MREFLLALARPWLFRAWREEAYPVTLAFALPPLMAMERAAVPWFGVRAFGPHMTGYVANATACISGCRAGPTTSPLSPASSTTRWQAASRSGSACTRT